MYYILYMNQLITKIIKYKKYIGYNMINLNIVIFFVVFCNFSIN